MFAAAAKRSQYVLTPEELCDQALYPSGDWQRCPQSPE